MISLNNGDMVIYNNATGSMPAFIHGNSASKIKLNQFGNYIGKAFNDNKGCIQCHENTIELDLENKNEWPTVTMAIFIYTSTPFIREFFQKIKLLNYPKSKITLLIHNNVSKKHFE
jgi:hypothetical protein